MSQVIQIETNPGQERLAGLGVLSWPTWGAGVSSFPWTYGDSETCYILEGAVTVTPDGSQPVSIKAGDLVTFPAGMSCTWDITAPIRKHYRFG
ncbi:MAG: DUF861 domain-containing protein [Gammaproteobacteria bacterium]|nr:MAG: DUF861 domain-containing protein [Gammaproteobacteria bacterium]